jgi:uncharacterized protein
MEVQSSIERVEAPLSETARQRLLSLPGEPLFIADWLRTLMIHYEVDPEALQKIVPFQLDLREGRAFVSVVAFTLKGLHPRVASRITAWLMRPISTHHFLNVRTYVRVNGDIGIYFLAEWLSNHFSVILGPLAFGLPYRFGKIKYSHEGIRPSADARFPCPLTGRAADSKTGNALAYVASLPFEPQFRECQPGSLTEWLMERYVAFTKFGNLRRFFRVWHKPWLQAPANVQVTEQTLLEREWPLFGDARIVGANFSPGLTDVWMGWPHRVPG